jgi:general secretion pathway protein L
LSTLYIRLPSKAVTDGSLHWPTLNCPFAIASNGNLSHAGTIERQGTSALSELSDAVAKVQRVVLLLAASDVSILRMQVPPMSSAKLKTALPNLVEEQLLCDPTDCVIVASAMSDGLRTIAVVQRDWLDQLTGTFIALGAKHIEAFPAQLCLSGQQDTVSAAIYQRESSIELTLRLSEHEGIGLVIDTEPDVAPENQVIQALCALAPASPVTIYLPQAAMETYRTALAATPGQQDRISFTVDSWTNWIAGARTAPLDLMTGSNAGTGPRLDWRPWRWPLALAAAVLLTNAVALNIDWWHMQREAKSLRVSMTQIYKTAYPNETVILDPIAQMQQKLSIARHASGMVAPDDFTALAAAFGEAWALAATGKSSSITALDYHDRSLYVHFKPGAESPIEQMRTALSKYQLALDLAPEQSGAVVWQIRSRK